MSLQKIIVKIEIKKQNAYTQFRILYAIIIYNKNINLIFVDKINAITNVFVNTI